MTTKQKDRWIFVTLKSCRKFRKYERRKGRLNFQADSISRKKHSHLPEKVFTPKLSKPNYNFNTVNPHAVGISMTISVIFHKNSLPRFSRNHILIASLSFVEFVQLEAISTSDQKF